MNGPVTTILLAVLGVVLVYFGFNLVGTSLYVVREDGPLLVALGLGAIGVVMVVLPVLVTLSQIRALFARRRTKR